MILDRQKLETELEAKYLKVPEEYLDQEIIRRSSLSLSSKSFTSFSSTSVVCLKRMNSQEAAEKLLHMLANPDYARTDSYEEAISMFTGEKANTKPQLIRGR